MASRPQILVETSFKGVEIVTVRVRRGDREAGLDLLHRTLPAIRELDRRARVVIPSIKIGKRRLIDPDDIDEFIRIRENSGAQENGSKVGG